MRKASCSGTMPNGFIIGPWCRSGALVPIQTVFAFFAGGDLWYSVAMSAVLSKNAMSDAGKNHAGQAEDTNRLCTQPPPAPLS